MEKVRVGTVLVSRGGTARVVRRVTRYRTGELYYVWFTIRHCSWTGRCYTMLSANDLIQQGYTPAGFTYRIPQDELNLNIERSLAGGDYYLKCCDVRGVR